MKEDPARLAWPKFDKVFLQGDPSDQSEVRVFHRDDLQSLAVEAAPELIRLIRYHAATCGPG
jgi:hypothetical protein